MSSTVKKKGKFPMGFYICSTTFSFERAAYYSSKYLIYIFLTTAIIHGGLGIEKGQAAIMQANLVAFTYLAPIIVGYSYGMLSNIIYNVGKYKITYIVYYIKIILYSILIFIIIKK